MSVQTGPEIAGSRRDNYYILQDLSMKTLITSSTCAARSLPLQVCIGEDYNPSPDIWLTGFSTITADPQTLDWVFWLLL
jgi:hypothetical protein